MSLCSLLSHPDYLRRVLLADALLSAATGLTIWLAAAPLSGLLVLPAGLLRSAGLVLLPFAAFVLWLSRRNPPARAAVWAVIAINVLWVLDSVWLLIGGSVQPSALGYAFVLAQALVVAALAELEYLGLRRGTPSFA